MPVCHSVCSLSRSRNELFPSLTHEKCGERLAVPGWPRLLTGIAREAVMAVVVSPGAVVVPSTAPASSPPSLLVIASPPHHLSRPVMLLFAGTHAAVPAGAFHRPADVLSRAGKPGAFPAGADSASTQLAPRLAAEGGRTADLGSRRRPGPREGWARAAPGNRFRRPRFLHPTQLSRPTGSPARPAPQTSPRMPYLSPHIRRPASDTRAGTHHQPSTPAILMCSQGP